MKFDLPAVNCLLRRIAPYLEKTWLRIALLITLAFVVHLPSLPGQLIWDDNYLVGENPFFRSPIFSLEVFRHHLFLDSVSSHYRPVQNWSYILDYCIWNGDLYGYHFSNILWHAAAAVLLFLLLLKVLPTLAKTERGRACCVTGSFLIALLWTVHPVHSAAVDYISGRADSLAFAFSCGAWLAYLGARGARHLAFRIGGYAGAIVLILLGLCSREIAGIWVVIFLAHLFLFAGGRSRMHRAVTVVACLLAFSAYMGLRSLPERRELQPGSSHWSALTRSGLMLRALGDYARLTVFPAQLHMERTVTDARMYKPSPGWRDQLSPTWLLYLGLAAAAALFAGACKRGPGRSLRAFGALWFTAGFLPISNLVEMNASAAEHWLYLPLVGLLLVFFGWMIELPARAYRAAAVCALFAAVALSVRSTLRSSDWLNARVFYERTIASAGWSPRLGLNLAVIYKSEGRFEEARQLLVHTLAAWPDYPLARSHLASTLVSLGETQKGDNLLARTAAEAPQQSFSYPRTWVASYQLARKEIAAGHEARALDVLAEARKLSPEAWPLVELESEIVRKSQGPQAALPLVEKFAASHWWQYPAFLALGKLKAQQNDTAGALEALRHACRLDLRETQALNLMARIELGVRNFPAALLAQERALSRQPDEPSQYLLYSEVLMQMGRTEQAEKAREIALRLSRQSSA